MGSCALGQTTLTCSRKDSAILSWFTLTIFQSSSDTSTTKCSKPETDTCYTEVLTSLYSPFSDKRWQLTSACRLPTFSVIL